MIISKKEHISYYKYAPYAQRCEQKHEHNEGRIGKHKQELNGTYRDKKYSVWSNISLDKIYSRYDIGFKLTD